MEIEIDEFIGSVQGSKNPIVKDPGAIWNAISKFGELADCRRLLFQRFEYDGHFEVPTRD
jgi:hypothetical protein